MSFKDRIIELRRVPAATLLEHPENFRLHPDNQKSVVRSLLEDIGFASALVARVTEDGQLLILDGHLRAGLEPEAEVPVLVTDLTEAEGRRFLFSSDATVGMAERDEAVLAALVSNMNADVLHGYAAPMPALNLLLAELDFDPAGLIGGLEGLGGGTGQSGTGGAPGVPGSGPDVETLQQLDQLPAAVATRCQAGDLWGLGEHRLLIGDSLDPENGARLFGAHRADCCFCSPPYGVGLDYGETYQDTIVSLRALLPRLAAAGNALVADGGFMVLNFNDIASAKHIAGTEGPCEYPMALEYWPVFRDAEYVLWSRRVWCKPNARVNSLWCIQSNRAASDFEHVWTFKRPGAAVLGRVGGLSQMGWFDSTAVEGVDIGKDTHGAGMPLGVATRMLEVHSRPMRVVYEPFCGTGTTLIAAELMGRLCYAGEINPAYGDLTLQRFQDATGVEPVLLERTAP